MAAFQPILPRKASALKQSRAALGAVAFQIGVLFAVERNRKKLTQYDFESATGVDQGYVSRLENGVPLPSSVTNDQIDELFAEVGLADAHVEMNFVKWWRDNH